MESSEDDNGKWRLDRVKNALPATLYITKLVAVSPSPKPWIDVFAISEKFNMAVTESGLDPKVRKMSITF